MKKAILPSVVLLLSVLLTACSGGSLLVLTEPYDRIEQIMMTDWQPDCRRVAEDVFALDLILAGMESTGRSIYRTKTKRTFQTDRPDGTADVRILTTYRGYTYEQLAASRSAIKKTCRQAYFNVHD